VINIVDNFDVAGTPDANIWTIQNYYPERKTVGTIINENGVLRISLQSNLDTAGWPDGYTGLSLQTKSVLLLDSGVTINIDFPDPPSTGQRSSDGYLNQGITGLSITNAPLGPNDSVIPYTAPEGIYFCSQCQSLSWDRGFYDAQHNATKIWVNDWQAFSAGIPAGRFTINLGVTSYSVSRNGTPIITNKLHGLDLSSFWIQLTYDMRCFGHVETTTFDNFSIVSGPQATVFFIDFTDEPVGTISQLPHATVRFYNFTESASGVSPHATVSFSNFGNERIREFAPNIQLVLKSSEIGPLRYRIGRKTFCFAFGGNGPIRIMTPGGVKVLL
jgi:hypothetical protein